MGKKGGGKKGKLDKAIENAEPNLPTIPEEEEKPVPVVDETIQDQTKKSKSQLVPSGTELVRRKSSKSKSVIVIEKSKSALEVDKSKSQSVIEIDKNKSQTVVGSQGQLVVEEDTPETDILQKTTAKKGKKSKRAAKDGEKLEDKPKKGKKVKKEKSETDAGDDKKLSKKSKKNQITKTENEKEQPQLQVQSSQPDIKKSQVKLQPSSTEMTEEPKGKKKKLQGKNKQKDKETQISEPKPSQSIISSSQQVLSKSSMTQRSRVSIAEHADIREKKKKSGNGKKQRRESRALSGIENSEDVQGSEKSKKPRTSSIRPSVTYKSASSLFDEHRKRLSSYRMSQMSSDSSIDTAEYGEEGAVDKKSKRKKGKKGKKDKPKKDEAEEETEEDKTRKQAEKEEARQAKKLAKKQAKAQKRAEKAQKTGDPEYDNMKKKLDEMKKVAKELGLDNVLIDAEGVEKGPKKKVSKKEKAKLTAELAEKAKAEMEAQAKRIEEMIKKKKEEDRLAAIEKDKRETVEQGLRMEQLQSTKNLIEEIEDANSKMLQEEKDALEWAKYLECGKLPTAAMCDKMNTYLHLWELELEKTTVEEASVRTTDAIKLLGELDELIDTATSGDTHKVDNWRWIRQLFRDYQSNSLDVATYRLLRDVDHNLNRINIPTADYNFKDDFVTLCIWLRVMLPIPLPNPRRPPKPRVDISFNPMDVSVLFPLTIDCENAAIRGMYLKYDHLSDLSDIFNMPQVPKEYYLDLMGAANKEWRTKLKYKFDNRDKLPKPIIETAQPEEPQEKQPNQEVIPNVETSTERVEDRKIQFEDAEEFEWQSDDEIPTVPFKQLKPTASEYALTLEDQLYDTVRNMLQITVEPNVINLRKYVILGGVFHLNFLAQPPQPQDFVTMDMRITGLYLPKKLKVLPFKVVYTPYIPPEPEPASSSTSIRKLPEELEEEIKKQEEELDKLIFINLKWPQHVIFLELPIICRWDEEKKQWSNEEIHDVKHNEDKCMVSFRTGVFGVYGLATCKYSNLPFQAYDIKPEADDSVTVQLTAAILMLEFNIKNGLIAITQLQNSPNMTLQDVVGQYMKLHRLKRMMQEAGIDIYPSFDAFCYVDGCCEKHWPMEQHLYYNMAQISNSFNFSWSRWNLTAGRRKIVVQMRQYLPDDKAKQKNHQTLLITPLKAAFIECTEVSQTFSEKEVESPKFCADLYHLMKTTSGIFVRKKVSKASKQNVYALAQLLISIRVLSFS